MHHSSGQLKQASNATVYIIHPQAQSSLSPPLSSSGSSLLDAVGVNRLLLVQLSPVQAGIKLGPMMCFSPVSHQLPEPSCLVILH